MAQLSRDAFAVMAMCERTKKHFGITVDPCMGKYRFVWAFPIKADQARREGYDKKTVTGEVYFDPGYKGCPYCEARSFYVCSCGKIVCYDERHGNNTACPWCGNRGDLVDADQFTLSGGGM